MTELRELLDPNHTLPVVRLDTIRNYDFGHLLRDQMNIVVGDKPAGRLDLVSEVHATERFAHFDGIEIEESMRGRGVGLATYALAIEMSHDRNFDFQTQNYELTEHSKKIWEHLAKKGVADVVEPFVPSQRFSDRFTGKYRVPIRK